MNRREMISLCGMGALASSSRVSTACKPRGDDQSGDDLPNGPTRLSVAQLLHLLSEDGINPSKVYGSQLEFSGEVVEPQIGITGAKVVSVRIEGWDDRRFAPYQTAMIQNLPVSDMIKPGDRMMFTCLIVDHAYGQFSLWMHKLRPISD